MQSPQESTIAAVFTHIEETPPFTRLLQLEQAGIKTVYILLDKYTLKEARSKQIALIDSGAITDILNHYEKAAGTMRIEFWDTGDITQEADKLSFYLNNVPTNHALNIFICQQDLSNLSQHTNVLRTGTVTTHSFLPFYKKESTEMMPALQAFSLTKEASYLIQQEKNPCICFQQNRFDIQNAQWLFQIFASFISVWYRPDSKQYAEADRLIANYNTNTKLLHKTQTAFEDTHKQYYSTESPGFFLRSRHHRNIEKKETLGENLDTLLSKMSRLCIASNEELSPAFTHKTF